MKKRGKSTNTLKAIIFDIGGVLQIERKKRISPLQKHSSGIHEKVARKLGIDLDQYFDSIDSTYAKSMEGKISKKELLETFSKNLETSKSKIERIYFYEYFKKFKLNKHLFEQAKKLKKRGYKIAILSDQWHLSKKAHVLKDFYKIFDKVLISCDVGIRKPDPKIYKLVLKKLKLKPSETIFIDNQKWNLDSAEKIGMKTILHKNNQQTIRELNYLLK